MAGKFYHWIECPTHGQQDGVELEFKGASCRKGVALCPVCKAGAYALGGAVNGRLPDGPWRTMYPFRSVRFTDKGERATECGPRCQAAKGPNCDCRCRGRQHGAWSPVGAT